MTTKEVKQALTLGQGVAVICRTYLTSNKPGTRRAYYCTIPSCNRKLQATPEGEAQIRAGAHPFCISCGTRFAEMAAAEHRLSGVGFNGETVLEERERRRYKDELERIDLLRMAFPYKKGE